MDAMQIMIMPVTGNGAAGLSVTNAETSVVGSEFAGLFGEVLQQNLLGLQLADNGSEMAQNPMQADAEAEVLTVILTAEPAISEILPDNGTESDKTVINPMAAYAQMILLQTNQNAVQQLQISANVPETKEHAIEAESVQTVEHFAAAGTVPANADLPAISEVVKTAEAVLTVEVPAKDSVIKPGFAQVVSKTETDGSDADAASIEKKLPEKQDKRESLSYVTEDISSINDPDAYRQMHEDSVTADNVPLQNTSASVSKTIAPSVIPVLSEAKQDQISEAVQQKNTVLVADSIDQSAKSQAKQPEVAVKAVENLVSTQELPAGVKITTAAQQPVRFSQSSDVVIAAGNPEGQGKMTSDQGESGSQFTGKASDGIGVKDELVKPEVLSDSVAPFELHEQHTVSTHAGHRIVKENDGVTAAEQSKTAVPQELVNKQVTDRLLSHEIKQGSDQISFKLSPENLGNLQLSMKMEDQRLKLEIVAENNSVRDALLQQADELKETLARQNIKVESFNVTTGNSGNQFQQSADWRQMTAEQRKYQPQYASTRNSGASAEGYGAPMQYFAHQYKSTIDVRF